MEIREASLEEVPEIVKMFGEFMEYHQDIIAKEPRLDPNLKKAVDYLERFQLWAKENIKGENSRIHVAEVDGQLAGYSLIRIEDNIPIFQLKKIGQLGDLFVRKQFRGMGISSKFKEAAFAWFKRHGVKVARLQVYPQNEGPHNIYKRWGFFDYHTEMRIELE